MYKEELKSIIASELHAIGITPAVNGDADLAVDWEFMDTKWSTGKKKIEYHNSAFFDEEEKTLYYWESTKEVGSGFSFGAESESSFQSGMTLFRKVKSIQYGPDGKAYEYELDLGQITKIYKENAKNNGWKFKLVLKKDKASFPVGYVPTTRDTQIPPTQEREPELSPVTPTSGVYRYCSNCGNPLEADVRFCGKCGTPVVGPAGGSIVEPSPVPPARPKAFPVETASEKPDKQRKPMKKGCLIGLIAVASILVLFLILMLLPGSDSGSASGNGAGTASSGQVTESSKLYLDLGHDLSAYQGGDDLSDYPNEIYTHDLMLVCSVWQDFMVTDDNEDPQGSKIKEIRISDFQLNNGPAIGRFTGLTGGTVIDPRDSSQRNGMLENGDLVFDMEEISKLYGGYSNTIVLNFNIKDIMKYTYPKDYSGPMDFELSFKNAGIKSDDMRFQISYQIQLLTMSGKTYTRNVEMEEFPGDFIGDPFLVYPSTRVFDYKLGQPFEE